MMNVRTRQVEHVGGGNEVTVLEITEGGDLKSITINDEAIAGRNSMPNEDGFGEILWEVYDEVSLLDIELSEKVHNIAVEHFRHHKQFDNRGKPSWL